LVKKGFYRNSKKRGDLGKSSETSKNLAREMGEAKKKGLGRDARRSNVAEAGRGKENAIKCRKKRGGNAPGKNPQVPKGLKTMTKRSGREKILEKKSEVEGSKEKIGTT